MRKRKYQEHFDLQIANLPLDGLYISQAELIQYDLEDQYKRSLQMSTIQQHLSNPNKDSIPYFRYLHLIVLTQNSTYQQFIFANFLPQISELFHSLHSLPTPSELQQPLL